MEGQRVAKQEGGGSKRPWIITGAVAGVLAAAYLGVCAWASGRDAILPNVSVSGIDVSNMTMSQAQETVAGAAGQAGRNIQLTLDYEGVNRTLNAEDLSVDSARSAQDAWDVGHSNFFTAGPQLVSHMLGASSQVPLALPEEDKALSDFLLDMEKAVADATEQGAYQVEDDKLVMTKGAPVATVDWNQVKTDAHASLQDAFEEHLGGESGPVEKKLTLSAVQNEAQEPDFEAIHREVYTEPKDASLDPDTMEITDHTVGVDFDVQELKSAYQAAKAGETFSIPLTLTQPKVTRKNLESQLFQDLLGEGTTRVSGSANRKNNVKLSAEACNGVILLPGEEFSYNNTTGSRTADKGYKNAPIYQGGQSVDDIGGGICQTSSTIYYAVLHTNLEVVERHCHQFNTGYVELGMDATVFYGLSDFRFRNSTDYPIKIVTNSYDSNGSRYLNVKIYGTNPEGVYAVPKSTTFDKVAPTTVYSPDPSVPRGTLVLDRKQYAYTGWSAHTYRYVYDKDGNEIEKQDMGKSKYSMRPNTYHYNPADGDPSTWVNGKPGGAAPDPGTTIDPGTTPDPGTTVDPGTTTDPGATVDPGTTTDPGATTPVEPEPAVPELEPPKPSDSGLNPIDPNQAAG